LPRCFGLSGAVPNARGPLVLIFSSFFPSGSSSRSAAGVHLFPRIWFLFPRPGKGGLSQSSSRKAGGALPSFAHSAALFLLRRAARRLVAVRQPPLQPATSDGLRGARPQVAPRRAPAGSRPPVFGKNVSVVRPRRRTWDEAPNIFGLLRVAPYLPAKVTVRTAAARGGLPEYRPGRSSSGRIRIHPVLHGLAH